ncbi:MAG TPA: 50S ribosomal protein L25 [Nitrolancea sp.]|jgi:large subunit ribosomal protein L25|nr:50S ribosomal protein L25 [Nitrolancea sp.]
MSDYLKLEAERRTTKGKEVKKMRRIGIVPGIIYGPAVAEPEMVEINARDFDSIYQSAGSSSLIDVAVGSVSHPVFIRHVSRHATKHTLIHAEFYAPNLDRATDVTVNVVTTGSPADTNLGVLNHGRTDVQVRGLPASIPQQFEVDLAALVNVDDAIHVSDLVVPEGVEILTPGDEVIVSLSAAQRAAESTAAAESTDESETDETAKDETPNS